LARSDYGVVGLVWKWAGAPPKHDVPSDVGRIKRKENILHGIIGYNDLVVLCPQFDVVLQTEIWLTFLSTFCAKTLAFEVLNMY